MDRFEKSDKMNIGEKLRQRDILEDNDGYQRNGHILILMEKKLSKIKIRKTRLWCDVSERRHECDCLENNILDTQNTESYK